jgi:pimeloyl-ACP methyl ester carboxylesterase
MMLNGLFKSGLTKNNLNKIDVEGYKKSLREGKTRAMYYFFSRNCNVLTDYSKVVSKIDIPVAIIWGANDSFLKWKLQSDTVIKDLKISTDNIQEEQPEKINTLILDFLKN